MQKKLKNPVHQLTGFSLLELLIVLLIMGILSALVYPRYQAHLNTVHRAGVQMLLLDLATRLEHYYVANHYSYEGATLDKLGATTLPTDEFYQLVLTNVTASTYQLQARPRHGESFGTVCGTLTLDEHGTKGVTGISTVANCW